MSQPENTQPAQNTSTISNRGMASVWIVQFLGDNGIWEPILGNLIFSKQEADQVIIGSYKDRCRVVEYRPVLAPLLAEDVYVDCANDLADEAFERMANEMATAGKLNKGDDNE